MRRFSALLLLMVSISSQAWADQPLPERGLSAAFTYPGLIVGPQDQARMDLTIRNAGRKDDTFLVQVTQKPEGWRTELRNYGASVTGLLVAGGEKAVLTLTATPPDNLEILPPGQYKFEVKIQSLDGGLSQTSQCLLTVEESRPAHQALTISTSYPVIKGPSDQRFSFALDLKNETGEDALVNLAAEIPQNWEAVFKPGYEDKQISSIQIPKGQNRTVALDLTPDPKAGIGEYRIKVRAQAPGGQADSELTVNLTGTYKLRVATAHDLLSTTTEVGKPVTMTLFVLNEGSAPQKEVTFMSIQPDNWKVTFKPDKLTDLDASKGPVPVEMTIIPSETALVGDYLVGVITQGEKNDVNTEIRVGVKASAAWAWVGSLVIVLVVVGLTLTFRRLGRR